MNFENLKGKGARRVRIQWDFVSQCEVWHVCSTMLLFVMSVGQFGWLPWQPNSSIFKKKKQKKKQSQGHFGEVLKQQNQAFASGSIIDSMRSLVLPTLNIKVGAGLGGSVGCAVWLETRRSRVQPPPRSATFFRGDWSWNIFYGHSLPSADSRRAVVSFWRKNVHNTG